MSINDGNLYHILKKCENTMRARDCYLVMDDDGWKLTDLSSGEEVCVKEIHS